MTHGQLVPPFSTPGDDRICGAGQLSRATTFSVKALPTLRLFGWVFFKCLPSLPRGLHGLGLLILTSPSSILVTRAASLKACVALKRIESCAVPSNRPQYASLVALSGKPLCRGLITSEVFRTQRSSLANCILVEDADLISSAEFFAWRADFATVDLKIQRTCVSDVAASCQLQAWKMIFSSSPPVGIREGMSLERCSPSNRVTQLPKTGRNGCVGMSPCSLIANLIPTRPHLRHSSLPTRPSVLPVSSTTENSPRNSRLG